MADDLPSMAALDRTLPSPSAIATALGGGAVDVVPIPRDCVDGFCHAWWRRPAAYLGPDVRASISGIARLPGTDVERAMARLAADISPGCWHRAHADLLELNELDVGSRLVVSRPGH